MPALQHPGAVPLTGDCPEDNNLIIFIGLFIFQRTNSPAATLKKDPSIPFSRIVLLLAAPLAIASSKSRLLSHKMREKC